MATDPKNAEAIKLGIIQKLKDLDKYADEELSDYIMVMIANKKHKDDMKRDLNLFLAEETSSFLGWLLPFLKDFERRAAEESRSKNWKPAMDGAGFGSRRDRTPSPFSDRRPKQGNRGLRALADAADDEDKAKDREKKKEDDGGLSDVEVLSEVFSDVQSLDSDGNLKPKKRKDRPKENREIDPFTKEVIIQQQDELKKDATKGTLAAAKSAATAGRSTTVKDDDNRRLDIAKKVGVVPRSYMPDRPKDSSRDRGRGRSPYRPGNDSYRGDQVPRSYRDNRRDDRSRGYDNRDNRDARDRYPYDQRRPDRERDDDRFSERRSREATSRHSHRSGGSGGEFPVKNKIKDYNSDAPSKKPGSHNTNNPDTTQALAIKPFAFKMETGHRDGKPEWNTENDRRDRERSDRDRERDRDRDRDRDRVDRDRDHDRNRPSTSDRKRTMSPKDKRDREDRSKMAKRDDDRRDGGSYRDRRDRAVKQEDKDRVKDRDQISLHPESKEEKDDQKDIHGKDQNNNKNKDKDKEPKEESKGKEPKEQDEAMDDVDDDDNDRPSAERLPEPGEIHDARTEIRNLREAKEKEKEKIKDETKDSAKPYNSHTSRDHKDRDRDRFRTSREENNNDRIKSSRYEDSKTDKDRSSRDNYGTINSRDRSGSRRTTRPEGREPLERRDAKRPEPERRDHSVNRREPSREQKDRERDTGRDRDNRRDRGATDSRREDEPMTTAKRSYDLASSHYKSPTTRDAHDRGRKLPDRDAPRKYDSYDEKAASSRHARDYEADGGKHFKIKDRSSERYDNKQHERSSQIKRSDRDRSDRDRDRDRSDRDRDLNRDRDRDHREPARERSKSYEKSKAEVPKPKTDITNHSARYLDAPVKLVSKSSRDSVSDSFNFKKTITNDLNESSEVADHFSQKVSLSSHGHNKNSSQEVVSDEIENEVKAAKKLQKQLKRLKKEAKKEKKLKKKLKNKRHNKLLEREGSRQRHGVGGTKDHSYKIKIKTQNHAVDSEGNALSKKQRAMQNLQWIERIKSAVGEDTRIEEDASKNLIVYISANSSISKKEVKTILRKVLDDKLKKKTTIADPPVSGPGLGRKLSKKEKRREKNKKVSDPAFIVTINDTPQKKALDQLARLAENPTLLNPVDEKTDKEKQVHNIYIHSSDSESSESESSSSSGEDKQNSTTAPTPANQSDQTKVSPFFSKPSILSLPGLHSKVTVPNPMSIQRKLLQPMPTVPPTGGLNSNQSNTYQNQLNQQLICQAMLKNPAVGGGGNPPVSLLPPVSGSSASNISNGSSAPGAPPAGIPPANALFASLGQLPFFNNPLTTQLLNLHVPSLNPMMAQNAPAAPVPYDPEAEKKSIIVLNVHFQTQGVELEKHFEVIGKIARVTIVKDRVTEQPKGMAYIQFVEENSVSLAKALDQTNFFGRPITVMPKTKADWSPQQHETYMSLTNKLAQPVHYPGGSWNRKWVATANQ